MRHQYAGAFAEQLHIRPWELDLLTVEDFDRMRRYIDQSQRERTTEGGAG